MPMGFDSHAFRFVRPVTADRTIPMGQERPLGTPGASSLALFIIAPTTCVSSSIEEFYRENTECSPCARRVSLGLLHLLHSLAQ